MPRASTWLPIGLLAAAVAMPALFATVLSSSVSAQPAPAAKGAAKPKPKPKPKWKRGKKEPEAVAENGDAGAGKTGETAGEKPGVAAAGVADAGAGTSSGVAVVGVEEKGDAGMKVYKFGAVEVEGRMKSPQIVYFLRRVRAEFAAGELGHRSFMPELRDTRRSSVLK